MSAKRRVIALILALAVVLSVTASLVFIIHEAHHDCVGEDCRICSAIAVCCNVVKTLAAALILLVFLDAARSASSAFGVRQGFLHRTETPVILKVKLLN